MKNQVIKRKKFIISVTIFCIMFSIVGVLSVVAFFNSESVPSELKGSYVAKVNERKIFKAELQYFIWIQMVKGNDISEQLKKQAMDELIQFKLEVMEAEKMGIKLERSDIDGIQQDILKAKTRGDERTKKYFYKVYRLDSEKEYFYVKAEERLVEKYKEGALKNGSEGKVSKDGIIITYNQEVYDSINLEKLNKIFN